MQVDISEFITVWLPRLLLGLLLSLLPLLILDECWSSLLVLLHSHLLLSQLLLLRLLMSTAPVVLLGLSLSPLDVSLLELLGHFHIFNFLLGHGPVVAFLEASHRCYQGSLVRVSVQFFRLLSIVQMLLLLSWDVLSSLWVGHVEEQLEKDVLPLP